MKTGVEGSIFRIVPMSGLNIAHPSFTKQTDSTVLQVQVAQAALKIDSAYFRASHAADEIDDLARRNESPSYIARSRVRADTGVVASDITDALNTPIFARSAGSFAEASPIQRWWRDSNTAVRHAIVLPAIGVEPYGKVGFQRGERACARQATAYRYLYAIKPQVRSSA